MKQVEGDEKKLNWNKGNGLIPAIIQDELTQKILMLGYMNQESFLQTLQTGLVTFFSRSRQKIWIKGETSGNYLKLKSWCSDCDHDSLLFQVDASGPTCHLGNESCFSNLAEATNLSFLNKLKNIIDSRWTSSTSVSIENNENKEDKKSYVAQLAQTGLDRIAQKVGEEAIEVVIAAKNNSLEAFQGEVADLLFHLMVLLKQKGTSLGEIVSMLESRHKR